MELRDDSPLVITSQDAREMELTPMPGESILDTTSELALMIRNVAFVEGHKWRLSNGVQNFFVTMDDKAFLGRVARGEEEFRNGDVLLCSLRTQQWLTDVGLKTEHSVLRVLNHIRAREPRNAPLPLEDNSKVD